MNDDGVDWQSLSRAGMSQEEIERLRAKRVNMAKRISGKDVFDSLDQGT